MARNGTRDVKVVWVEGVEPHSVIATFLGEEEDFLKDVRPASTDLKLRFDIVLHILKTKKTEMKKREEAAKNRERKQKLLAALERKQEGALEEMSEEDLQKELAELDDV